MPDQQLASYLNALAEAKSDILDHINRLYKRLYGDDDGTTGDINLFRARLSLVEKSQQDLQASGTGRWDMINKATAIITLACALYVAFHTH